MSKKVKSYRDLFEGIDKPIKISKGKRVIPINFDNGATTPPFKYVDKCVKDAIANYGSIGRGAGQKSQFCTELYENSRQEVLDFFNLKYSKDYTVIYVKNTTEGLNLLADALIQNNEEVLSTRMEHHANDLPWRAVTKVSYVGIDDFGRLNIDEIEEILKNNEKIKYVTVTGASNVTGFINPIHEIAKIAHKYGAKIIVDGAQLVAHKKINMLGLSYDESIDYLVFSGHKIYAPFGSGAIVGLKNNLENCDPLIKGGGAVDFVLDKEVYWLDPPSKFEAGTPNLLGVVALKSALKVLNDIGFNNIQQHESMLREYILKSMFNIPNITIYGDITNKNTLGVIPFNANKIHHEEIAQKLADLKGIAVRNGCFCAQPYVKRLLGLSDDKIYQYIKNPNLLAPGMIRISFGLYNTKSEIDVFLNALEYIVNKR
jgi:selenocysteine lyase/cysteine desulfurase